MPETDAPEVIDEEGIILDKAKLDEARFNPGETYYTFGLVFLICAVVCLLMSALYGRKK